MAEDKKEITSLKSYVTYAEKEHTAAVYNISECENGELSFSFAIPAPGEYMWHLYTDFEIKVSNVVCTGAANDVRMKDSEDGREAIAYFFAATAGNVLIKCHVESMTKEQSIAYLKREYGNRVAHIEQLLQSERDFKANLKETQDNLKETQANLKETQDNLKETQDNLNEAQNECTILLSKLKAEKQEKCLANSRLEQSQQELQSIQNSHGWKLLQLLWKISGFLLPMGSTRRLLLKIVWKFLRHPVAFMRQCTPDRIKKFFRKSRRQGMTSALEKLDDKIVELLPEEKMDLQLFEIKDGTYPLILLRQNAEPLVSIVIPVYNQFDYTYLCLKSITEHSGDIPYEVILADDCSTDQTQTIADVVKGVRIVRNQENLRFLKNCNNAAKEARGKYILFLNNDTQVQPNWLQPLVELIERDNKIGMVGSKLVYPDGSLQEAGGILWKDGSAWNYGRGKSPLMAEFNYVRETDYISGAAIMIRRTLWEEIGGFDERFAPAYCEDSDLAFEVRRHGYQVMYQPASVVVHFEGVSNGTDTSSGQKSYQVLNQKKFLEKWGDVMEREHFENGENVFLACDRSTGKKHLLMVDHYVPQYDKDAGSRTVFQYLKLFAENGYQVTFIGDNFYPHQPYTATLQQMGIQVLYGNHYAGHWKEWLKENGTHIDYAFLNRPHISVKYIDLVREHTPAFIAYYGHDLHFLREYREYELTGDKSLLKSSEEWKEKELSLMEKADIAYYPSCVEEEEIHRIAPEVRVKAIPAYLFSDVRDCDYHAEERGDIMFVGGFGHRPNVDAVLWFAGEVMPFLRRELPDVTVHILGSNPPEEIKALSGNGLHIAGFVTDEELEDYYRRCRLTVVPLRYGAGIKGKVVEAMRYGLPVVTTGIGAEGIAGAEDFLAVKDSAEDFAAETVRLYRDSKALAEMSRQETDYVRAHFSPENAIKTIGKEFGMED